MDQTMHNDEIKRVLKSVVAKIKGTRNKIMGTGLKFRYYLAMLCKHKLSEFQQGFIFCPKNKVNTTSAELERNAKGDYRVKYNTAETQRRG